MEKSEKTTKEKLYRLFVGGKEFTLTEERKEGNSSNVDFGHEYAYQFTDINGEKINFGRHVPFIILPINEQRKPTQEEQQTFWLRELAVALWALNAGCGMNEKELNVSLDTKLTKWLEHQS